LGGGPLDSWNLWPSISGTSPDQTQLLQIPTTVHFDRDCMFPCFIRFIERSVGAQKHESRCYIVFATHVSIVTDVSYCPFLSLDLALLLLLSGQRPHDITYGGSSHMSILYVRLTEGSTSEYHYPFDTCAYAATSLVLPSKLAP